MGRWDERKETNVHVLESTVADDGAGTPLAVVVAVFLDLEPIFLGVSDYLARFEGGFCRSFSKSRGHSPSTADTSVSQGVIDLLEVCKGRTLVAGIHDIVGAGGESVSPDGLDGAAGVDGDDLVGGSGGVGASVAGKVVGGHVGDGTIVGRSPDAVGDRVGGTAGLELDEDGVG